MMSGFEGLPAGGNAPAAAVRDDLARRFGWLVAQFADQSDLDAFAARLLHVALPGRTPLILCGASSCALYLVAQGALSITVTSTGRRETDPFGDGPRNAAAETSVHGVEELTQGASHRLAASDAGGALTLGHIQAGGWIGENGLLNLEPAGYGITVARDARLLVLTNSQFIRLRHERPGAASTILQIFSLQIADRFRAYRRQITEQAVTGRRPRAEPARGTNLTLLAALLGI